MNPTNRNLNDSVSYTAVSFEEDQDYTDNNDIKDIDDKDNEHDKENDDRCISDDRDRFEPNDRNQQSLHIHISFDPNNQVSFENKVKWKQEDYALPPLAKVPSIEQALFHLKTKSHYQKHLYEATNENEKMMITNIYNILEEFIIHNFAAAQSTIHVSNIVQSDDGVYLAFLDNRNLPKIGFSLNFLARFQ